MRKINFTKMVASGNDFVIIYAPRSTLHAARLGSLAREICDRKFGAGADGLLLLEKSKVADIKMRIFNPDGSEAEMCGNGSRCIALYSARAQSTEHRAQRNINIETKAGIIDSTVKSDNVKIKLTEPKRIKLDIPIKVNSRLLKVNFIDTGVPHAVIFVEGLDKIDVLNLGRQIRYHKKFYPEGANVDFVEVESKSSIKVRTYERGVEDETLACGTGAAAAALLYAIRYTLYANRRINVVTQSGETLIVHFNKIDNNFEDIWLEGKVKMAYKGEYYVNSHL